jgi:putative Mn2+ efflux pump MntP
VVSIEPIDNSMNDAGARQSAPAATTTTQERSFPLIALLQLATFMAALVTCIDSRQLSRQLSFAREEPLIAAACLVAACLVVGVIGVIIGASQLSMKRSALAGGGVGILYGVVILAVYVAPAPIHRAAAAAALVVLTTLAIRIRAD